VGSAHSPPKYFGYKKSGVPLRDVRTCFPRLVLHLLGLGGASRTSGSSMLGGIRDTLVYSDRTASLSDDGPQAQPQQAISDSKLPVSRTTGSEPEAEEKSRMRLNVKNKLRVLDRLWYQSMLPALASFESRAKTISSSSSNASDPDPQDLSKSLDVLQRELWATISSVYDALEFVVDGMSACADEVIIQNANLIRSMMETFLQRKGPNTPYFLLSSCVPLCLRYMDYWSERTPLYYRMYQNHAKWTVSNFYQTFNQMTMLCTYLLEHIRAGRLTEDLNRMSGLFTGMFGSTEDVKEDHPTSRRPLPAQLEERTVCACIVLLLHVLNNVPYLTAVRNINVAGVEDDGKTGLNETFDSGKFGFMTDSDATAQRNRIWRVLYYVFSVDSSLRQMLLSNFDFAVQAFRDALRYLAMALNQAGNAQVLIQFAMLVVNLWPITDAQDSTTSSSSLSSSSSSSFSSSQSAPLLLHLASVKLFFEITLAHFMHLFKQTPSATPSQTTLDPQGKDEADQSPEFTPSFTNSEDKKARHESFVEDLCNVVVSRFDRDVATLTAGPNGGSQDKLLWQMVFVPCFALSGIYGTLYDQLENAKSAPDASFKRISSNLNALAVRQLGAVIRFAMQHAHGFSGVVSQEREKMTFPVETAYLSPVNSDDHKLDVPHAQSSVRYFTSAAILVVGYQAHFDHMSQLFEQVHACSALILIVNVWCSALDLAPITGPLIDLLKDVDMLSERAVRRIERDFNARIRRMNSLPQAKMLPAMTKTLIHLFNFVESVEVRTYVVFRMYLHSHIQATQLFCLEKLLHKLKDPIASSTVISSIGDDVSGATINRQRYSFRYKGVVRLTYVSSALFFSAVAPTLLKSPGAELRLMVLSALANVSHVGATLPADNIATHIYRDTNLRRTGPQTQGLISGLAAACMASIDTRELLHVQHADQNEIEHSVLSRCEEHGPNDGEPRVVIDWLQRVGLRSQWQEQKAHIQVPLTYYDRSDWIDLRRVGSLLRHSSTLAALCEDFDCLLRCISLGLKYSLALLKSLNESAHILLVRCLVQVNLKFPERNQFVEQVSSYYMKLVFEHVGGKVAFNALTRMLSFLLQAKGAYHLVWDAVLRDFLTCIDNCRAPDDNHKIVALVNLYFQVLQVVDFRFLPSATAELRSLIMRRVDLQQPVLQAAFKSISQRSDLYRKDWCVEWYERLCKDVDDL
jgi:hypothetical protein